MTNPDERWEERAERGYEKFSERPVRTGFKWLILTSLGILVIGIIVGIFTFIGSWFNAGKDIVSPENVKKQYQVVIDDWNGMKQQAEIACRASNAEQSNQGPVFLEDPAFAYKNNYNQIAREYDSHQDDIFRAGLVGPKGYPKDAPTLEQMQTKELGLTGCK